MFLINILLHIVYYDIWFYFSHIMLHNKHFYFIHKIHHHKPYNLIQYYDTHDAHIVENIIQPIGILIPYLIMSEINMVTLLTAFCLISIRGLMRHDDRCSWLIGNHHILHHKYPNYNFGEFYLDSYFGTICPHKSEYIYGKIYN